MHAPPEEAKRRRDVLGRCREISIVKPFAVLDTQLYSVSTFAAVFKIGLLEIESVLGEPVFVGDIVDHVGYVESISGSGVDVGLVRRVLGGVVWCIEDQGCCVLRSWVTIWAKCDYVIPTASVGKFKRQFGYIEDDERAYAVTVVLFCPSLCQPNGDEVVSAGSLSISLPSGSPCLLIGTTLYDACATKFVIERILPECAQAKTSTHVSVSWFRNWATCVSATVWLGRMRYWSAGG